MGSIHRKWRQQRHYPGLKNLCCRLTLSDIPLLFAEQTDSDGGQLLFELFPACLLTPYKSLNRPLQHQINTPFFGCIRLAPPLCQTHRDKFIQIFSRYPQKPAALQ